MIQTILDWLKTYPEWKDAHIFVDTTCSTPGNVGLYPTGMERLSRREDVLGNVTVRNRNHFRLYRVCAGQSEDWDGARWISRFQDWVQLQDMMGLAPHFGDDPKAERIIAHSGKLHSTDRVGTVRYTVELTVDYEKTVEATQ